MIRVSNRIETQLSQPHSRGLQCRRTHYWAIIEVSSRCGSSSVGRALAFQAGCRGFESRLPLPRFIHRPHPLSRERLRVTRDLQAALGISRFETDSRLLHSDRDANTHEIWSTPTRRTKHPANTNHSQRKKRQENSADATMKSNRITSPCMIDAFGVASTIIWRRMSARYVSGSTTAMGRKTQAGSRAETMHPRETS